MTPRALRARVVQQALADIPPDGVRPIEPDGVRLLVLEGPAAARTADSQQVLRDVGKSPRPDAAVGVVGAPTLRARVLEKRASIREASHRPEPIRAPAGLSCRRRRPSGPSAFGLAYASSRAAPQKLQQPALNASRNALCCSRASLRFNSFTPSISSRGRPAINCAKLCASGRQGFVIGGTRSVSP